MEREQVNREGDQFIGLVPYAVTFLTDADREWKRPFDKKGNLEAGFHGDKVRELIGLAHSAITSCIHCAFYHTEMARLNGASESEIKDAVREPEKFLEKIKLMVLQEEGTPG
jgi:AhpD family alkylhydroperoxidase